MTFKELGLQGELLEGLEAMGFDQPTPIQETAIPIILKGSDLIGCAQTGTGKTGAFLIPLLNQINGSKREGTQAVILVPTRELAIQIDQALQGFSYFTDISAVAVYGGSNSDDFTKQKRAIQSGADVIVATPGRFKQHLGLGYMKLDTLTHFILDEADRMMDMGFIGDIKFVESKLPKNRQTLLFSATMAAGIRKLSYDILKDPQQINLAIAKPAAGINQRAINVYDGNKIPTLKHLIDGAEIKMMIIFAAQKSTVDSIQHELKRSGYKAEKLHSGMDQKDREATLLAFKQGKFNILAATDILSRGIDIDDISHVLNYNIPNDAADYVHRIGRTARAGKSGAAISFIDPKDQFNFWNIEQLIERTLDKENTPEDIGDSPIYDPKKPGKNAGGRSGHRSGGRSGGRQGNNSHSNGKRKFYGKRNDGGSKPKRRD